MQEHIDVDEFMAYVREQGFDIVDLLFTRGIRTFVISGGELLFGSQVTLDIEREHWYKISIEDLVERVDQLKYMLLEHNEKYGTGPIGTFADVSKEKKEY